MALGRGRRRRILKTPAQVVVAAFLVANAIGFLLLSLPLARAGSGTAPPHVALFTSTSAVCVTGLTIVDTATYWSGFGQVVILALIQVGGFGIMTLASLVSLFLVRRLGLRTRLTAAAETKTVGAGDVRRVLRGVGLITLAVESALALILIVRLHTRYAESWPEALWHGVFHAISAFNNAGFSLYSDNLVGFAADPWFLMPICVAIIVGGLGFPVIMELVRGLGPRRWSLHTKMTITMTVALLVIGAVFVTISEWDNPGTMGSAPAAQKVLDGFFHGVQPRTAGFNAWDYGQATEETTLGTIILMFIGGGSAGTAGGLKVTTFLTLFFVILAEVRGEEHVVAFDRRLGPRTVRTATTVALLGVGAVMAATVLLTELSALPLREVLFEAASAFGTVGLSMGITPDLGEPAQLVIVALMFLGRLGPITLVSALALRQHTRRYTLPEGAPLIG